MRQESQKRKSQGTTLPEKWNPHALEPGLLAQHASPGQAPGCKDGSERALLFGVLRAPDLTVARGTGSAHLTTNVVTEAQTQGKSQE